MRTRRWSGLGRKGYGGGEGKAGWVLAAGGVGPGFHELGRGCHGGGWGRVRVLIEGRDRREGSRCRMIPRPKLVI
jgi:hypothetical protein